MATHFFTSAAVNYLPKARVLASSIRRHHPDGVIHLVLCDLLPPWFQLHQEPFDSVWGLDDLDLPADPGWRFSHNIVELSTAVKGFALVKVLNQPGCDSVIYFDPDIVVLAPLEQLLTEFESGSILLTPHSTEPDHDRKVIEDNEIVSLRHGTFNLGFLGVKNDFEGRRFAAWWRDRLRDFCFDDVPYGLFTDQRWADLVPSFFPGHRILTDPAYNVCTWNLNSRTVTGSLAEGGLRVNGMPLVFYHFSGLDRGAQKVMLQRYGRNMPALFDLRAWYKAACEEAGHSLLGASEWGLNRFDNGEPVLQSHRDLYRRDSRVRQWFPDPYRTAGPAPSFIDWYKSNGEIFAPPIASVRRPMPSLDCQYRVIVVAEPGARANLDAMAKATHSDDVTVMSNCGHDWARLLADTSDRDLAIIDATVEPPWQWDRRLAWSAERNLDAVSISPVVAPPNTGLAPEQLDRLAFWTRLNHDPEIAALFRGCCYLRSKPLRQLIDSESFTGLAALETRASLSNWRHRLATHVCVTTPLSASPDTFPTLFAEEIRMGRLPLGRLPRLSAAATDPVLHIVNENSVQKFREYCCYDHAHDHLALIAHGHAQQHGTSFRLSRYSCSEAHRPSAAAPDKRETSAGLAAAGESVVRDCLEAHRPPAAAGESVVRGCLDVQKLESWPAGNPIRAFALSHAAYRAALDEVMAKYRPGQVVIWSLLGHSLDCLHSGLPTLAFAGALSLPDLRMALPATALAECAVRELPDASFAALSDALVAGHPEAARYFSGPQAPALQAAHGLQLYWDVGQGYGEGGSATVLPRGDARQKLRLQIPPVAHPISSLRLDIGTEPVLLDLFALQILDGDENPLWTWNSDSLRAAIQAGRQLALLNETGATLRIASTGPDAYFILPLDSAVLSRLCDGAFLEADVAFDNRPDSIQRLLFEVDAQARIAQAEHAHSTHLLNQRLASSERSVGQAQLKANQLEAQRAALEGSLASVTRSVSWRLTAPIRLVKQLLRPGEKTRPQ